MALVVGLLCAALACPALAVTEEEVQAQVDAMGKEAVSGNLFIWFLCAIAFLKASQKVDSFMQALGISVGRTGGSMLAEAMVAARGVGMVKGGFSGFFGGGGHGAGGSGAGARGSSSGSSGAGGSAGGGFFSGGLAGMVGRHFTNSAIRSVTGQQPGASGGESGSAPSAGVGTPFGPSGPSGASESGPAPGASQAPGGTSFGAGESGAMFEDASVAGGLDEEEGPVVIPPQSDGGSEVGTGSEGASSDVSSPEPSVTGGSAHSSVQPPYQPPAGGVGRRIFEGSMAKGGGFATRVISSVALGSIAATGTMTGPTAAAALSSYLGYGPTGGGSQNAPRSGGAGAGGPSVTTEVGQSGGAGVSSSGGVEVPPSPQTIPTGAGMGPDIAPHSVGGTSAHPGTPHSDGQQMPDGGAPTPIPMFSHVEIGGGRITGVETAPGASEGVRFAMYSADQYMEPDGTYSPITTQDGAKWYKQYAKDVVDKQPYKEDGEIKYHESIVKRMPPMPRRKDKS